MIVAWAAATISLFHFFSFVLQGDARVGRAVEGMEIVGILRVPLIPLMARKAVKLTALYQMDF